MTPFFGKGKNNEKKEEKIIQLIRSWYYNNGKSIEEIITELKDGWGLGDEQIKDLLIRAGLIAPGEQYAKLPMQRKLTAMEALTFKTIAGQSSASQASSAAVKQMIDSAISELEAKFEKRIKMLDKNISDVNALLNQYKAMVDNLQKEVETIKQMMDDKAILSVLSNIRNEINEIMDKIESLRMLLNENKEKISKLESKIALLKISALTSSSAQTPQTQVQQPKAKAPETSRAPVHIRKYSFEDLFTTKVVTPASEPESETLQSAKEEIKNEANDSSDQFKSEIMEILKILEE